MAKKLKPCMWELVVVLLGSVVILGVMSFSESRWHWNERLNNWLQTRNQQTETLYPRKIICPQCNGTGQYTISREDVVSAYFSMYLAGHAHKCEQCQTAIEADNENKLCDKAAEALQKIRDAHKNTKDATSDCDCDGGCLWEVSPGVLTNYRPKEDEHGREN